MAAPILQIDISGGTSLEEALLSLQGQLINTTAILDEATALLLNRLRRRFLQQIDPDGNPWEPSYAAFRRSFGIGSRGEKRKAGGGTLFDTGRLFRSIQLFSVGADERGIGTDVPYAPFHNFGTKRMPQRAFLGFGAEDALLAQNVVLKKVKEALAAIEGPE